MEAISEDVGGDGQDGCCCCEPGHLPGLLSLNTAWSLRWLAWHCTTTKYITEGYSITENSAVHMLQLHELRSLLVDFYVKCIVYYALQSAKLPDWLANDAIGATLAPIVDAADTYVDVDGVFSSVIDRDYDQRLKGVSLASFTDVYGDWVRYCVEQRRHGDAPGLLVEPDESQPSTSRAATTVNRLVLALAYTLSLVGRRALGAAAQYGGAASFANAENFLYGIHSLFKGDFRDTCVKDEWIYADVDLLRTVIAPGVRMALKLHQEHFAVHDELLDGANLYNVIQSYESYLFISHEHDPAWRTAVLADTPALLALRHVVDDGSDDFKVIMLTRRFLNFRVIKLNSECVRAFWAGQQQELIFLRNRNPERGSIQNAKPVLRNMINSSADQPIGYPIYVSPLTTSFVETHADYARLVGRACTPQLIRETIARLWRRIRHNFGTSGSHMSPPAVPPPHSTPAAPAQSIEMQTITKPTVVSNAPACDAPVSPASHARLADMSPSTSRSLPTTQPTPALSSSTTSSTVRRRRYSSDLTQLDAQSAVSASPNTHRRVDSMVTLVMRPSPSLQSPTVTVCVPTAPDKSTATVSFVIRCSTFACSRCR